MGTLSKMFVRKVSLVATLSMILVNGNGFAANPSNTMKSELDREVNLALSTETPPTSRKKKPRRTVRRYKQVSINSFTDSTTDVKRMKEEAGSNKVSTYEEMMNTTSTSLNTSTTLEKTREKKFGFNVYTYYNGADALQTTGNSLSQQSSGFNQYFSSAFSNGQYSTTAAYGFGLEHSNTDLLYASSLGMGYAIGATYEFDREIDRGYINKVNGQSVKADNPSLSLVLPYANFVMTYKNTYYLLGLNYSVPQMANASDEIYQGGLGYQLGAGMDIGSYFSLEATYRWVNFSAAVKKDDNQFFVVNQDSFARSGLGILADESFQLNGLNITLKLRF